VPLRIKWVALFRYLRISVFVVLFFFLLGFVGFMVTGRAFEVVFFYIMITSIVILVVQLFIFVIFKVLETSDLKERMDWFIREIDHPKNNEKLEELWLAIYKYEHSMKEKSCAICGLELLENAPVIKCLKCEKIFHEKHFIKWLRENDCCPNCKNLILPFD